MADGAVPESLLESMLVRLMGDGSSYVQMLQQAQQQSQIAAQNIESATSRIQDLSRGLQGFASSALSALSSLGVGTSLAVAFQRFSSVEQAQIRLKAAIEASGRSAQFVIADYEAFTSEMTASSLATKSNIRALIMQSEQMGVQGEKAKELVRYAVAISAAKGGEASQYFRAAMAIQSGNLEMAKYQLGLRGIRDKTELAAKIQQLLASGFKTQGELLGTTSGQIEKLKLSLAGLTVEVGKIIGDAIRPFIVGLREVADWVLKVDPAMKKAAVAVVALFGAFLAAGPIIATFRALAGLILGAVLSPMGLIVSALAGVAVYLQLWVDRVGGVTKAWEITKQKILEVKNIAVEWVIGFIVKHQQLVLVLGIVGTALTVVVAAYKMMMFTISFLNGLLTILYIKQTIQRVSLFAWASALRVAHLTMLATSAIMRTAFAASYILAMTSALVAQTAIVLAWRAVVFTSAMMLSAYQGIVIGIRTTLMGTNTAIVLSTAAFRILHGIVLAGAYIMAGIGYASIFLYTAALLVLKGVIIAGLYTMAAMGYTITALKTIFMGLWAALKFGYEGVMGIIMVFKTLGTLEELLYIGTMGLGGLLSGLYAVMIGGATVLQWAFNAALATGTVLETIFTFGLNILISVVAALVVVVIAAVAGWAAWNTAVALATGLVYGLWGAIVALASTVVSIAGAFVAMSITVEGAIGGMFVAITSAGSQFLDVLLAIPGTSGPLLAMGDIFRSWIDPIMGIYHAITLMPEALEKMRRAMPGVTEATTGLQLAWEIARETFLLAVDQMRALWPPLWEFIKVVAQAAMASMQALWSPLWLTIQLRAQEVWGAITEFLWTAWQRLMMGLRLAWQATMLELASAFQRQFGGATQEQIAAQEAAAAKAREMAEEEARRANEPQVSMQERIRRSTDEANREIERQKALIADAAGAFNLQDTDEIKARKARIQELLAFVNSAVAEQKEAQEAGYHPEEPFKEAEKAIKDYDAALFGSAEAYRHVTEYMERLDESGKEAAKVAREGMKPVGEGAGGMKAVEPAKPLVVNNEQTNGLLSQIRDLLKEQGKGDFKLELKRANLT